MIEGFQRSTRAYQWEGVSVLWKCSEKPFNNCSLNWTDSERNPVWKSLEENMSRMLKA